MNKLLKFYKKIKDCEEGSSIIIIAFSVAVLAVFAALVMDLGMAYYKSSELENAIDAATLAAADKLPNTTAATIEANKYIELNGFNTSDFTISFSSSNSVVKIIAAKKVDYNFAKVIGLNDITVSRKATAKKISMGGAFDYALFSGSTTTNLILNGSNMYVDGSAHTNKNFFINGSYQTITGQCEAVNLISINGSSIDIPNRHPLSNIVDMPDFSETIRLQAEAAGTVYNGNKTYNQSQVNIEESIYVNGNVTINGSAFTGKGCIFATGSITLNGSNSLVSPEDSVCFYSKNGNITVNGSGITVNGIIYAPNGRIIWNGSNLTVNGRIIGNSVTVNGSNLRIISSDDDLGSLPSSYVKLIE